MRMKRYTFYCPNCQTGRVTFLPEDEYFRVSGRTTSIDEILPDDKFNKTYKNFFQFGVCSECQEKMLGQGFAGGKNYYDSPEIEEASFAEANVSDMWERARRS